LGTLAIMWFIQVLYPGCDQGYHSFSVFEVI